MRPTAVPIHALAVLACVVAAGACIVVDKPPAPPEPPGVPADFWISLERTPCFGFCPVYTVSADAGGAVTFEGRRFVAESGTHRASVDAAAVRALYDQVVASDFFALEDCYCERVITDMPSSIVTVTQRGRKKQVTHYKGDRSAPAAFLALEQEIDRRTGSSRWVEGSPDEASPE